ncbi:MAG: metallophosphoesterase [Verrucomicrobia bacterium]|nr:metallophosphoesterase [Verrucomicrobiota bacterium]
MKTSVSLARAPAVTRRQFVSTAAAAAGLAVAPACLRVAAGVKAPFSFVLLGDLHYDQLEHHDLAWLDRTHPKDLSQIKNYSRITTEVMPRLFATVRATVQELNRAPATRVAFVLQAGDLVEGLCGSEALAARQNTGALACVREARLGAPFLFTKGNHDVTGDGAKEAFAEVFHPFLTEQARAVTAGLPGLKSARYTVECGNAQFVFFDAYEAAASLEWFEAVAARRTAEHCFVVVHPPVVPYGARATWHLFSAERDKARREKFLGILGRQRAFVLGGHIHKYATLAREAGGGRFAQLALSSVVGSAGVRAKTPLSGLVEYTGDQIRVEPDFSPDTAAARRAVYEAERPFVRAFEYADLPGYAVVTVDGPRVQARMYAGVGRELWRTVDLSGLLHGAG